MLQISYNHGAHFIQSCCIFHKIMLHITYNHLTHFIQSCCTFNVIMLHITYNKVAHFIKLCCLHTIMLHTSYSYVAYFMHPVLHFIQSCHRIYKLSDKMFTYNFIWPILIIFPCPLSLAIPHFTAIILPAQYLLKTFSNINLSII